jgi:Fic family protein
MKNFIKTCAIEFCIETNKIEDIGETNEDDTREILEDFLVNDIEYKDKKKREITNTYNALKLLNKHDIDKYKISNNIESILLTVYEIKEIHETLMNNLLKNGGQFRTCPAFTKLENNKFFYYSEHETIENNMFNMIDEYNVLIMNLENQYLDSDKHTNIDFILTIIKLSAKLLFNLVDVHAFSDGNGRICRLFANHILNYITPFPINILCDRIKNRNEYVNNIILCRNTSQRFPIEIAEGYFLNILNSWSNFYNSLNFIENINITNYLTFIGSIYIIDIKDTENIIKDKYDKLNHKYRYDYDTINKANEISTIILAIKQMQNNESKLNITEYAYITIKINQSNIHTIGGSHTHKI